MIEIVYEKEKQKPEGNEAYFRVPNNIRQIGEIHETQKIYIEDYAYTYLCRISDKYQKEGCAAILLGQANYKNGVSYLFIKSAIGLLEVEVSEDHLQFGEETWNYVYEKNQEYFQGQEVVGWCLSLPGCLLEPNNLICKTHLDHFGGKEKVLFLMESLEKEEAFFRYEEGRLNRLEGFYIYYEKNLPMQNFLVDENKRKETKSEQVEDHAVKTFRKKIENKAEVQRERKNTSFFRVASICLTAMVLAIGVLYMNDYQKLKKTEEVIAQMDKEKAEENLIETEPVNGWISEENAKEEDNTEKQGSNNAATEKPEDGETDSKETEDTMEKPEESEKVQESAAVNTDVVRETYTIQNGDTLSSISRKYYGNLEQVKAICELNGLSDEDLVYPGQKILLP